MTCSKTLAQAHYFASSSSPSLGDLWYQSFLSDASHNSKDLSDSSYLESLVSPALHDVTINATDKFNSLQRPCNLPSFTFGTSPDSNFGGFQGDWVNQSNSNVELPFRESAELDQYHGFNLLNEMVPGMDLYDPFVPNITRTFNEGPPVSMGDLQQFSYPSFADLNNAPILPQILETSNITSNNPSVGPVPVPAIQPATTALKPCTHPGCTRTFARDWERTRHESSIHGMGRRLHYCHVVGCFKHAATAGMRGYKRSDKLVEHLWKKHPDLGYTKRVA